jgi:nucleoside-diphosphate-sugar epimerase
VNVFVSGGSGFVGRNLIAALVARGDGVVAVARSDAAAAAVKALGARVVRGDLADVAVLRSGMSGCQVAFHSAALVDQWGDPRMFERVNVQGTANMLEAARTGGVPRFVHVGTEAVLAGGGPIHDVDETRPRAAHPIGLYPASKARAEALVIAANGAGLETLVCRPRLIWGKGDLSVLPRMLEVMRKGQWAWISGGRYLTSTSHVRNVVEGLLLAAVRGRPGEIYFLTDGAPLEFRAFITAQARAHGVEPGARNVPRALLYAIAALSELAWRTLPLKGGPLITRTALLLAGEEVTVNDAKARRELGYVGRVTLDQGLAEIAVEQRA